MAASTNPWSLAFGVGILTLRGLLLGTYLEVPVVFGHPHIPDIAIVPCTSSMTFK